MHQILVRRVAPIAFWLVLLACPSGASAQLPLTACKPAGFSCGTLDVPLDYGGVTPGTVHMAFTAHVDAANAGRPAVVALPGGPGSSGLASAALLTKAIAPALATRDLLIPDLRGTGKSALIRCKAAEKAAAVTPSVGSRCAHELGASRGFFTTAASVRDLEALRVAGGYDKLMLFGVSYGTKLAEDYAAAYPSHVEALVLDSVVPPDGLDAFGASSLRAMPRALDDLCAGGLCAAISPSPSSDLAALVATLQKGPVGHGKTKLTETTLADLFFASDMNPLLDAALPAGVHAAAGGDPSLLFRAASAIKSKPKKPSEDNSTLLFATGCEDALSLPFARNQTIKDRETATSAALAAAPAGSFGPFSGKAASRFQGAAVARCLGWAFANPAPAATGPLPPVPALVIDGQADIRTNVEDAQSVAAAIGPSAHLLPVPFVGHSASTNDPSGCVTAAMTAFFAGAPIAACDQSRPLIAPLPLPPASLKAVPAAKGLTGRTGRTLSAAVLTILDADTFATDAGKLGSRKTPGLHGGRVTASKSKTIRLVRDEYVRGVVVSGRIGKRSGRLRISGSAAAHGVLVRHGRVLAGTLGGRHVRFALPAG